MLINPCSIFSNPANTGSECSDNMKATAQLWMVPKNAVWADSDLVDFTTFLKTKIHAAPGVRWYPIFGSTAPVKNITDAKEADVIETHEDGSVSFIRYGMYNRTFMTTEGGFCLAQHLMSFSNFSYAFIEVDITGQIAMMKNADGTYSGFPMNLGYAATPDLANFKTTYKNNFMISFSPMNYIKKGKVFATSADEDVLSLVGLLDSKVLPGTATQSITNVFVDVKTSCGETDLVVLYNGTGAGKIGQISNFVVTKKSDGTVITPTAVAIINNAAGNPEVRLTGTYITGTDYLVALAAAATLKANGLPGYEGVKPATVSIP